MLYLGSPGRMVGIKCPVEQRVVPADGYSFQQTLEGRVKAQVVPGQRRAWDLELGDLTTPEQVAALMDFANGAWGKGPFWFVSADAAVVNLLCPDDVAIPRETGANTAGGPMRLAGGGWAANSTATTTGGQIGWRSGSLSDAPVLPGVPVTGSAWVIGDGAHVVVQFMDSMGELLSTIASATVSPQAEGVRVSVTGVPPAGAVQVRVFARDATRATRPAVTWTDQPYEFGDGQGCPKAVVHAVSRGVVKAWRDPRTGRWSNMSFTVQEVG